MAYKAFTLIEALASTALAALLIVAVLGVSQSTARHHKAMDSLDRNPAWVGQVFERIDRDLQHARSYSVNNGHLKLAGYSSLDTKTFEPTHRPVIIEYRLVDGALIRSQTALDVITTRSTTSELVCTGLDHFELTPPQPPPPEASQRVRPNPLVSKGNPPITSEKSRAVTGRDQTPDHFVQADSDESLEPVSNPISLQAPAPDPTELIPGFKPLAAGAILGVSITRDVASAASYDRLLMAGGGQ